MSEEVLQKQMVERATKMLGPYEANAAPLLAKRGESDSLGHIQSAHRIVGVLRLIDADGKDAKVPSVSRSHWPSGFQAPDHIDFVKIGLDGKEVISEPVTSRQYRSPGPFVEGLEEFLIKGQTIKGL